MSINKNKLLLHICCGPCAVYPSEYLEERKIAFDGYFYNPNIHPFSEYSERRKNVIKLSEKKDFELITEDGYQEDDWLEYVDVPTRCKKCYSIRFKKAFEYAKNNEYKGVTTSLLVSPYQHHDLIKEIGESFSKAFEVPFVYIDFRPGFREGQQKAKELGLYRQKYCGCLSSLEDKLDFDIKKEERKEAQKHG